MSALWTSAEAEARHAWASQRALLRVNGLSIDTRTLKPGDLFVALKGDNRDGHDFVRAAFDAKAAAALVSRAPDGVQAAPLLTVANTQRGLEDLARAARARSNAKIVAVTGSAGKTTTKEMLRLAFDALGHTHASAASYNNHWGVPLASRRCRATADYGVFEVGMNHFGEIRTLVCFRAPACGAGHHHRAGASGIFRHLRSHRRRQIRNLRRPGCQAAPRSLPADSPYAERLIARAPSKAVSHTSCASAVHQTATRN